MGNITRRQLLLGGGGAVAASAALFGGSVVAGRASLENRIKELEWDRRDAKAINALYSFVNPHYTEEFTPEQAFSHLKDSLVIVHAGKNEAGEPILSTGVLIGDYVLCTHHGIESLLKHGKEFSDVEKNEMVIHGKILYGFRFVDIDKDNDLALLNLLNISSNEYFAPATIAGTSGELKIGRDIRVLGYIPPDQTVFNQVGKIKSVGDFKVLSTGVKYPNKFITDAYAKGGFSGGVLADPNGSFLGIVQFKKEPEEYAGGVGWGIINPFLLKAAAKESERLLKYKRT